MAHTFDAIETERLRLRPFVSEDLDTFHAYRADPAVAQFQGWEDFTREDARAFLDQQLALTPGTPGTGAQIAIERKADASMVGDVFFYRPDDEPPRAQIGYTLQREAWGHGYASEAVRGLLGYAFDVLALHRVTALTDVENERSIALLERVGMRREAHFVENEWCKGRWCSEFVYAMLRREWRAGEGT